jgi:hypothetical protein
MKGTDSHFMDIYWAAVAQLIYAKYRATNVAHQTPVWSDLDALTKDRWVKLAQFSAEVLSKLPR